MQDVIERFIGRLKQEYPDCVAIVLKGSHARGEATKWSDIDMDVLVSTAGIEDFRTWIEPVGERLVHISAAVESLSGWLADTNEPSSWSMGLPTIETTKLVWASDEQHRLLLDQPFKSHPAPAPEVEDTMEALLKTRSAFQRGDSHGVYRNAEKMATLLPTLLVPINPHTPVSNSRAAITAILNLTNVPERFPEDWLYCMGYVDERMVEHATAAAGRLFRGTIDLLPADAAIVGPDIARIMADGSLLAYINQEDS